MRTMLVALALGALLFGGEARAQFQNKSVGLSVGYVDTLSTADGSVQWSLPFGVFFTLYLESHFELLFEADGIIAHTSAPVNPNIWGVSVTPVGVRYQFLEEDVRPYAGLDLSYLHFFPNSTTGNVLGTDSGTNYAGVGPNVGIDFFVSDNFSIGVKARYNLYISLNSLDSSFDATARVATYW